MKYVIDFLRFRGLLCFIFMSHLFSLTWVPTCHHFSDWPLHYHTQSHSGVRKIERDTADIPSKYCRTCEMNHTFCWEHLHIWGFVNQGNRYVLRIKIKIIKLIDILNARYSTWFTWWRDWLSRSFIHQEVKYAHTLSQNQKVFQ